MNDRNLIEPSNLHKVLTCDFETGKLYWRHREDCGPRWNGRYAGKEAFTCMERWGYMTGRINKTFYKAHRVVWAMMHGEWPTGEIDHINGNRSDNRIENLRVVSKTENAMNAKRRVDNSSGCHGVVWHKGGRKWMVRAGSKYLGLYPTLGSAIEARMKADIDLGFHENHGRPA